MSNITRFIPKTERIKSALADEARQIVFDLQLPDQARYRLNPHVAWNGDLQTRKAKAEQMSIPLEVIEGGKRDDG